VSEFFEKDFILINLAILQRLNGPIPFDIFIERAPDTYTKIFKRSLYVDFDRVKKYTTEKKVHNFFVAKADYEEYLKLVGRISRDFFEKSENNTAEEIISVVKDVADLTLLEVIRKNIVNQESIEFATSTIKGCVATLGKDKSSLVRLLKLISAHPCSFRHAITTTVFSLLLGKAAKIEGQRNLEILGLGALLHDVGMSLISAQIEEKVDLTPEEWKEIKSHPEVGKRIIEDIKKMPTECKLIILQHHEQPNGNGYPNNLYGRDIYYLAKIVSIADTFSALILPRPYRTRVYSVYEALDVMIYDRGKFDQKLVETFSTIFVQPKKLQKKEAS
jgi:HD-GYP domain-containing protein (c-di-GMP phosphodiesterase class II)